MTALRNRRARSSSNHPNTIISAVEIDFALDNQNPRCGERSKLVWTQPARGRQRVFLTAFLLTVLFASALSGIAATANGAARLAAIPPMGWNDWAHYQCNFNDQTILANAKALVTSGLSKHGYNTVTIDDCWMQKTRDAQGNLQADPQRFPHGIEPIAQAVHALGLQFGIYEDAGYETCGGFAGSGEAKGRGKGHFLQDAKLFASWGVDYLKLDGCNVYVSEGSSKVAAYRKAYAAQSAALKSVSRPIVFSESAPAYFQGTPDWYVVLKWVRDYGQLWREGTDIATFDPKQPNTPRFDSVLWNYAYNLPLGRFQKPANWNDADFIIGGDSGMSMAETRSQLALWSMMSAPLILSSDLDKLTPEAVAILGNPSILAIDQDRLGRMATLVRRSPGTDVLMKTLSNGDYAIAVLNRSDALARTELRPTGPPTNSTAGGVATGCQRGRTARTSVAPGRSSTTPSAPCSPWSNTSTTLRAKWVSTSRGAATMRRPVKWHEPGGSPGPRGDPGAVDMARS